MSAATSHMLKIWPSFFRAVCDGHKSFEVRLNDRDYKVGDTLELCEFGHAEGFTGNRVYKTVDYIYSGLGVAEGYAVLGWRTW